MTGRADHPSTGGHRVHLDRDEVRIYVDLALDVDTGQWSASLPDHYSLPVHFQGLTAVQHADPATALRHLADMIETAARSELGHAIVENLAAPLAAVESLPWSTVTTMDIDLGDPPVPRKGY